MTSPPPYADVFEDEPDIPWIALKESKPLSRLHTAYWGRPIERNELETEQPYEGQPMNDDEDQSEIGPGCFILNFYIEGFPKLWIRKDFIRIYDHCHQHVNNFQGNAQLIPPSVIIRGQPGIGKSYWIYYAVRRRLAESSPFLWYYGKTWHLFVRGGVFQCPGELETATFRRYPWAFVDADRFADTTSLLDAATLNRLFIILSTSPQPARWKLLKKNTDCKFLTMNPWSWAEIQKGAALHGLGNRLEEVRVVYKEHGPIPRVCIDFVNAPHRLEDHEQSRLAAIGNLSLRYLIYFARQGEIQLDASHSIFLVRRPEVDNLTKYIVEPISDSVALVLQDQLMRATWDEQVLLYETTATSPMSRAWAGRVFEAMAQRQLREEVALDLVPMKREAGSGNRLSWWIPQHNKVGVSSSTDPNAGGAANTPISIRFKPKAIFAYDRLPDTCQRDVFYVPRATNQVAFDSFILHDTSLFIFQMTIAAEHTIKRGIMDSLAHRTLREAKLHFIFVVPPNGITKCPESKDDELNEFWEMTRVVPLFTAVFDSGKYTGQTIAQAPATHSQGSARAVDTPAGPSMSTRSRSRQERSETVVSPEQGSSNKKQRRKNKKKN